MSARRGGGSYRERRVENILDVQPREFGNPWNFYALFSRSEEDVHRWCRENGILATTFQCPYNCDGQMSLKVLARAPGGSIFRCTKNRDHTKSSRTYSFFDKSNLMLQDIMVFIKSYLEKSSLAQCVRFSGMAYGTTAVNWASFTRELFKEYFYTNLRYRKMQGVVEIDESLFGRRVKFHRGNPNRGLKIWIFGMVERDSNTLVMYPVSDRTEDTLLPIIERHVEKGSTIYSDGWSAYCKLNDAGYDHFTVLHKYSFKKTYINTKSQEVVEVHTNRIEGAWKHAKDHFRRLVGTKLSQFEGHLAEIMWRSAERGNIYEAFFNLLRSVYPLDSPPHYTYPTPLFNTWEGIPESQSKIDDWEIRPENTDAESEAESQIETTSAELFSGLVEEDSSAIMPNRELSSSELQERQLLQKSTLDKVSQEMLEGSGSEDEGDTTLTELTVPGVSKSIPQEGRPVHVEARVLIQNKAGPRSQDASSDKAAMKTTNGQDTSTIQTRKSTRRKKPLSSGTRNPIIISSEEDIPGPSAEATLRPVPSTLSAPKKTTKAVTKRMRTDKVCHPADFKEKEPSRRGKRKTTLSNPYAKTAFVWTSDDDDFQ